ncbi:Cytoplasmic Aconitate Hydratase [Manis pentadactyla]|nr:Cytoplasmic Aconitate Hydratase [Manis pentadactyla]
MTAATPRGSNASQAPAVRPLRAPTAKELQSYGSPPGEDPAGKRQTWGGATSWSEVLYRENKLIASEEGGGSWSMVGVAGEEISPAGPLGLAHSITLGQLQVLQMASLEAARSHCQLLFMSRVNTITITRQEALAHLELQQEASCGGGILRNICLKKEDR